MEEEPNEHELEERLYAMLHHVDETQASVNPDTQNDATHFLDNAPQSTVRRYWRTSGTNTTYQKTNTNQKENAPTPVNKNPSTNTTTNASNTRPKEEKCEIPAKPTVDLSLFQSPPRIVNKVIEILEFEPEQVVIDDMSDEDEVIEVALPPKPTFIIESSDEDDCIISKPEEPSKQQETSAPGNAAPTCTEREVSASPVPSVVSSVSDEFIRSDCIALNISSRRPDNHSFDFSLHGSDLLGQVTPSKKKKKKKTKEPTTSTPVSTTVNKPTNSPTETCFATPKSKAKNKKQKNKSYIVSEKSLPSTDVYDSDSNQSAIETRDQGTYVVTEKSVPSVDIYESDSSQHGETSNKNKSLPEHPNNEDTNKAQESTDSFVDLTENDNYITLDSTGICNDMIMANVIGFPESEDYGQENTQNDANKFGSTKVPQILFDNLDFDNLKGKDKVCKRRRYSLTTLRAEMEKFYNESWGGEDFNHREIQKYMSRDKSLWVIDPKDRMPALSKRKVTCNYCNRAGHRDDTCRIKPPVCYMCGSTGHYEPRCPSKICVNCGSPNHMYSTMCRNCSTWGRIICAECGQGGHPASHCPDIWRRYHNTISNDTPLVENRQMKKNWQLYCSGCTRRGHLVHTCRLSLPFSGLPLNSPYVALYRPVWPRDPPTRNKRLSKSPTLYETHPTKKKNMTITEIVDTPKANEPRQRKISQGKNAEEKNKVKDTKTTENTTNESAEVPAPDFIPISSGNTDKRGQIIQDNEVSDTSDAVTTSRIYITNEVIERLKTAEGKNWLEETTKKHNVEVQNANNTSFLNIKGKFNDQEAFQCALRDWMKPNPPKHQRSYSEGDVTVDSENDQTIFSDNMPKKREILMRILSKALDSLKLDLGDPKAIYKELNYLQNKHENLTKQKIVSPKQLSNNRDNINQMLKKLNMLLLGQAGLAGGSKHLSELQSLYQKLTNTLNKKIPIDMRNEIGQHYHYIFTSVPRDDYAELLNMYYANMNRKETSLNKRNRDKLQVVSKKRKKQNKTINPIAAAQTFSHMKRNYGNNDGEENTHSRNRPEQISLGKLIFYHKRIMSARPADSALKKRRMDLARKLHSQIAALYGNTNLSSKAMKKVRRIQEQAVKFLKNV